MVEFKIIKQKIANFVVKQCNKYGFNNTLVDLLLSQKFYGSYLDVVPYYNDNDDLIYILIKYYVSNDDIRTLKYGMYLTDITDDKKNDK